MSLVFLFIYVFEQTQRTRAFKPNQSTVKIFLFFGFFSPLHRTHNKNPPVIDIGYGKTVTGDHTGQQPADILEMHPQDSAHYRYPTCPPINSI